MGIGELNEGALHAALKTRYCEGSSQLEVPVGNFVADVVADDVIYEIQTGSFSGLRRKLTSLVEEHRVVLVHPIAVHSVMVKLPKQAGGKVERRKVPKTGTLAHILNELVYLPDLLNHPNFAVEVLLTKEEQIRSFDPKKRRGLGGWRIHERCLLEVVDSWRLHEAEDLLRLVDADLPEQFTSRELAKAMQTHVSYGQKLAYCLRHAGVTELVGEQGNAYLYAFTENS